MSTTEIPTMLEAFEIPTVSVVDTDSLTLNERCDSCSAAALVRATHESALSDLLFCGSHAKRNVSALIAKNWKIDDQTYRMFPEFKGSVKRVISPAAHKEHSTTPSQI